MFCVMSTCVLRQSSLAVPHALRGHPFLLTESTMFQRVSETCAQWGSLLALGYIDSRC